MKNKANKTSHGKLSTITLVIILLIAFVCPGFCFGPPDNLPDGPHPRIWLTSEELSRLNAKQASNNAGWITLQTWCDAHINDRGYNTDPPAYGYDATNWKGDNDYTGYRMAGYNRHIMNYALAYQILKDDNPTKAITYASRVRTLIIDGVATFLRAGEEPNGLWALRIGNSHDISINSSEVAAVSSPHIQLTAYKKPYASRNLACIPIAYDWIYESGVLSAGDKTVITNMLLRWFDWIRGLRSAYNNGVLVDGTRYHEDRTGNCTGSDNCTTYTGVATIGYDYNNVYSNIGTGHMYLMSLIPLALYGDNPDIPTYLTLWKNQLADYILEPLSNDLKHSGGESVEGWNYGGGYHNLLQGLYGHYTATGDSRIANMQWIPDLITSMLYRLEADYKQVPLYGYWTGTPVGVNRKYFLLPFMAVNQRINPTSTQSRIGQWLFNNVSYDDSSESEWDQLLWPRTDISQLDPAGQPLVHLSKGNGFFSSRSSWANASDTVVMTTHLENKHSTDHEGYDKGHFSLSRGTDRLLTHQNSVGDAPPTTSFNTISFNDANQYSRNPVVSYNAIDRIESSNSFSYVRSDLSNTCKQAWSTNRCELFLRSFLNILPNKLVILDVTRSNSAYSNMKNWYTQYIADPALTIDTITATTGTSNVFVKSLFPSGTYTKTNPASGFYRVKFTPSVLQEYDQFLHVIEATASTAKQTPVEKVLTIEGKMIGAYINDASKPTVALFNSNKYGGDVTVSNGEIISYNLPAPVSSSLQHILVHLPPNIDFTALPETSANGVVTFKLKAGAFPVEGKVYRASEQGVIRLGQTSKPPEPPKWQ